MLGSFDGSGMELQPYDQTFHRPATVAGRGRCGWHGIASCDDAPVVSFEDPRGHRQAGCDRARQELVDYGATDLSRP